MIGKWQNRLTHECGYSYDWLDGYRAYLFGHPCLGCSAPCFQDGFIGESRRWAWNPRLLHPSTWLSFKWEIVPVLKDKARVAATITFKIGKEDEQ